MVIIIIYNPCILRRSERGKKPILLLTTADTTLAWAVFVLAFKAVPRSATVL